MSLWHIAWSYLWNRKFTTFLTILSVALAVGLISSVLTLREETRKRFEEEGQAFDLVVGAKGSPLQLVLSSVYFMDAPTGNIPIQVYEEIKADKENVQAAFPIAMGDSYQNFRLVGTVPELFDHKWVSPLTNEERHPFQLAAGRIFERNYEVVLGALAAEQTGLDLDDTFVSTHGLMKMPEFMGGHDHSANPYRVVGVLKASGSPYDRAIFCNMASVWDAHAHEDEHHGDHPEEPHEEHGPAPAGTTDYEEWGDQPSSMVTAVLVQLQSPALSFQYKEKVRESTVAMAARPIDEVAKLFEQFLGTVKTVLLAVGYLVVVISALSIMIGLYLAILQRKRDLAIMRALGAARSEVFGAVIIEAFWVTLLGIVSGWFLGGVVTYVMGLYLTDRYGLVINAFSATREHWTAFATVAVVGLLAGVAPAWQAYRRNVARDLSDL
jgi:putative ABC transport system permease protein